MTALATLGPVAPAAQPSPQHRPQGPGWELLVVVICGLLAAGGYLLDNPILVVSGVLGLVAMLLLPWLPAGVALPAAGPVAVAAAAVLGVGAHVLGPDLTVHPAAVWLAVLILFLVAAGSSRRVDRRLRRPPVRPTVLAYLPAAVAAGVALLQGASTHLAASWAFKSTDLAQHMIALAGVQRTGNLDYAADGYPRGLHMLLALTSAPLAPNGDALLGFDLRVMAGATWLCLALMLAAAAATSLRLGEALGLRRGAAVAASLLAGTGLLLCNGFIVAFVYMGAAPSLLAVTALWVLVLLAAPPGGGRLSWGALVLLASCGVLVLANLWQALLGVPVAAMVGAAVLRSGRRKKAPVRLIVRQLLAAGAALVAALPPVLGVSRSGGIGLAAIAGYTARVPVVVLVLELLSLVVLVRHRRSTWAWLHAGTVGGLLTTTGLLMYGAHHGFDLTPYYVMKGLWFLALFLVPLLACVSTRLTVEATGRIFRLLGRTGAAAGILRVSAAALTAAVLFAFALPTMIVPGSRALDTVRPPGHGTSASTRRLALATDYGTRYAPARTLPVSLGLGPFPDPYAAYIVSKLISFRTGQPVTYGRPRHVCADVRALGDRVPPVVITTMPAADLAAELTAEGCGAVRIEQLPGSRSAG